MKSTIRQSVRVTADRGSLTEAEGARRKLLFLVTEDWYFVSHRLDVAKAALAGGYDVAAAVSVGVARDQIVRSGLRLIPLRYLHRRSRNPWTELRALLELIAVYRRERPHIVHQVALKPVLYGSLAARLIGGISLVNALAGLGFVFSSASWRARLLRPVVRLFLRVLPSRKRSLLVVQNPDDQQVLVTNRIVPLSATRLIRGSGVDMGRFAPRREPAGVVQVLFASRMIWDKGIREFVEAAKRLRRDGVQARFALVGQPDDGNPTSVPRRQLERWHAQGDVEWWGFREDMDEVIGASHIVCLPSAYGEGVPKVLIEAAASGRAIIASDIPGCREIVKHEENGLLVPVRDSAALAVALRRLIEDGQLRRQMGIRGRKIAEREFSIEQVTRETLAVYRELLERGASHAD